MSRLTPNHAAQRFMPLPVPNVVAPATTAFAAQAERAVVADRPTVRS